MVPETAYVVVVALVVLATMALPVELEATIALPVPLCTALTIWSVVVPLKLVGPWAVQVRRRLALVFPDAACVEVEPGLT